MRYIFSLSTECLGIDNTNFKPVKMTKLEYTILGTLLHFRTMSIPNKYSHVHFSFFEQLNLNIQWILVIRTPVLRSYRL